MIVLICVSGPPFIFFVVMRNKRLCSVFLVFFFESSERIRVSSRSYYIRTALCFLLFSGNLERERDRDNISFSSK